MAELTEPLVIIVGAVCEKCGAELMHPQYLWDGRSTPVAASAVRHVNARHRQDFEDAYTGKPGPDCGGRVLFASEPYEPEKAPSWQWDGGGES